MCCLRIEVPHTLIFISLHEILLKETSCVSLRHIKMFVSFHNNENDAEFRLWESVEYQDVFVQADTKRHQ